MNISIRIMLLNQVKTYLLFLNLLQTINGLNIPHYNYFKGYKKQVQKVGFHSHFLWLSCLVAMFVTFVLLLLFTPVPRISHCLQQARM